MKTDQPIYLYLSIGPEAFRVHTGGLTLEGAYRFSSVTLKGLERRLDGICEPVGRNAQRFRRATHEDGGTPCGVPPY